MAPDCQAGQAVPTVYGAGGGLGCDLPMGHQSALHYDRDLHVFWMAAFPGQRILPEDVPAAARLNEDLPAAVAAQWMRGQE